ncbi:MAG: T9SS type A sorting domain-containing protein [Bacteroidota bacterium]
MTLVCGAVAANAQVTGTKTIGVDYATLAGAVTALNTSGISGPVIINIPAGYTETAPTGGYQLGSTVLNAATSSAGTLTIRKSGTGVNPVLTAPVGTSTTVDGIFIIRGTDYVTITGLDLAESPANITPTTQMEWGYALVKLNGTAPFDGCNNVAINNSKITLNMLNTASAGIYAGNHTAAVNTALAITATSDAMSNCTFAGNTITNVNTAISLNGYTAAAAPYDLYDQHNTIGTATGGNTITEFGGTATAAYGIYLAGQHDAKAMYNNITSAATPGTGIIRGIFHGLGVNSDFTASYNTLQLRAATGALYGIANGTGAANTGITGTGTITITNNTFQNYSFSATNTATNYLCFYNYAGTTAGWALGSVVMNNNTVQNMNNLSATGTMHMFYNYYCNANDVRFNNNKINSVYRSSTAGSTYCYYNYYGSPTGGADSVVGNKITNVSSPYNLYCIYDYMTATTRDRIVMNDTIMNDTAGKNSTFYSLYGIYTYYGNNVTVKNCRITNLYGVPANSTTVYGLYRYYGTNAVVSNNLVSDNIGYSTYGIYSSSASSSALITNNTVNNLAGTTGSLYGLYSSSTGTNDMYNNTVRNMISTSGTIYGLYNAGGSVVNVYNDTVYNITNSGASVYGFYSSSGTTINAYNLHIARIMDNGATGSVYGLYASGGTTLNFYRNLIDTVTTAATTGTAYGIYESGLTTFNCYRNKVSYVSGNGTGGSANGMYLNSGTVTAYNNIIGNLHTPNYTTATANSGTQLVGIYCGSATAVNLYHNTVHLNGASAGANFGSTAVYASTTPSLTMNNNIFMNTSTPAGTGMVAAYRRSSTTLTTYMPGSDNNLFYAGTPGINKVILWDGTAAYQTLTDYKTLVTPRDGASVTENGSFQSLSGIGTTFLHPVTTAPTQVESNGTPIATITDDHYGTLRAGSTGYTGAGAAPDLGAVEDEYIPTDLSAPNITYTMLPYTCATGDRTFTASITDLTGMSLSGATVPRVYYRKGTGVWFSRAGIFASGTSESSTWNFTIGAADMGGLILGDTVSYFVIAQDTAAAINIGSDPAGAVATDVNTVTTYPAAPNRYVIAAAMAGSYNVGVSGDYATITAAVAAYNAACISGPVTFLLTDTAYNSETLPITINGNPYASAANTLTIRPAAGVTASINDTAATSIFMLNGADYVIIDGANNPVANSICPPVAASRDLTIKNNSTATTSAVIWLRNATIGDGATNNIVRNVNISGSGSTYTLFGIGSGGASIAYTSSGNGNNNNRFENNSIRAVQTGIFSRGASAANKNNGTVINQNVMNEAAPGNLRNNGIFTGFENNITISGNELANISNGASNDIIAINLGFNNNASTSTMTVGNDVTNAVVTHNKLTNISQTNTFSCLGIAVAGVSSGTTLVANNMLSGVISKGTSGDFSSGIFIGGAAGGGTNVYYNSVNVTGTLTGGTYPNYAIAISGSNPVVNLKNNVFVNNNTVATATLQYAIGLAYTTYTNLSSNNNNFYSVGTRLATVGTLAGTGTAQPTLDAWRTTTGEDANSKNINPVFTSATDLRLAPVAANLPLMDSGAVVTVTNDIDCSTRSTTPDIGINEFTIPPCGVITAGTIAAGDVEFCGSGASSFTLPTSSTGLGIVYQWYSSADSVSWTPVSGAVASSYSTPTLTATTYYRVVLTCTYSGSADTAAIGVTIHPLPVITATPDGGAICITGTGMDITAAGAATYTWSPATGLSATTGAVVNANPAYNTSYTVTGTDVYGCVSTHSLTVTVSTPPAAFTLSPSSATRCEGDTALLLTAIGPVVADTGAITDTSGSVTIAIPDITPAGVRDTLAISGIPAGATITGVSVNINAAMTYDGDLTFNLTAPNGSTLNLINRRGGTGEDFVNTTVSSDGTLSFVGATAPFTNTYKADAAATGGTTVLPVTTSSWAALFGAANGDWILSARDWATGDAGTITSWTVTVNYTYNPAITWSPSATLYTNAAATVPYTGTATTSIYARPAATTTYTATMTVGGCSTTAAATVSVNPAPAAYAVTGGGSYCAGGTGVHVGLANSEAGISYQLYNGAAAVGSSLAGTGAALDFGLQTAVGTYSILATNTATGCTAGMTGTTSVSVDPLPVVFAVAGGGTICAGDAGVSIGLSGSETGISYQLYNGTTAVGTTVPGTGSAITFGLQSATGTYTVLAINVATSCTSSMSGSSVVVVNPLPVAYTVIGGGSYCAGSAGVSVGLSNSTSGISYQLYKGGVAIGSPLTGTGAALDFGIHTDTGSYSIVATNPATSCFATMTGTATISIDPLPAVFTVTGGGSYCAGGTGVSIGLGSSEAGINYQLYNGAASVGPVVAGTGSAISFGTQTAVGTYTVVAINAATGCSIAMSGSAVVSIDPLPVAFTVTGGGSYCTGGTGMIVGLSGSAIGTTYQLLRDGVIVGTPLAGTGAALSFGYQTASGTYNVVATITATGCVNTMSGTATVTELIIPAAYAITGGGSYCDGGTGVGIGLSNSELTITYQLYNGGTPVGTPIPGTGSGFSFGAFTAVGTYSVVASNAIGCATDMTGTATVSIDPLPAVFSLTGGGVYCDGGAGVAIGLSGSEAGLSYQLFNGAAIGAPVMGTGAAISFGMQTIAGAYMVIATNTATGCAAPMTGSAEVFINPTTPPAVSITSSMGDTMCLGTFTTFTATPVDGGYSPTYQWSVNGVNTGAGTAYSYIPANGDVVRVRITSSSCATPDTGSSAMTLTVTSYVTPSVSVTVSTGTTTCDGTPATFTAVPVYGGSVPTYRWVKNGISVATGPTYTTVPEDGDSVYCYMFSTYPCRYADSVRSTSVVMNVTPIVAPTVTIVAHPGLIITAGQTDTLVAIVTGGGTAPVYVWKINGVVVSGATTATFISNTLHNGDIVSCHVTTTGPCGGATGTNSVHITVTGGGTTGVNQVTAGMDVKLMPNPNKGAFTIKGDIGTGTDDEVNIEVTDMLGQVVYRNVLTAKQGQVNEQVQLSNTLANGMYILNLRSGSNTKSINFVIGQ